ncbi:MAG: DUF1801 domain-containing protein [Candidatus Saccharibacteria bacterium]
MTKPIFNSVVKAVEGTDKKLTSAMKWGRLTFGLGGDYHHWICAVYETKKSTTLIFHFGGLLEDKRKVLIAGDSVFFRKLEFTKKEDVDEKLIRGFVSQAIKKLDYFKKNWREINRQAKAKSK